MAGKQLHLTEGQGHEVLQTFEHKARAHRVDENDCNCRAVLAHSLKQQALARQRAKALLRKGGHPYEHRTGL